MMTVLMGAWLECMTPLAPPCGKALRMLRALANARPSSSLRLFAEPVVRRVMKSVPGGASSVACISYAGGVGVKSPDPVAEPFAQRVGASQQYDSFWVGSRISAVVPEGEIVPSDAVSEGDMPGPLDRCQGGRPLSDGEAK